MVEVVEQVSCVSDPLAGLEPPCARVHPGQLAPSRSPVAEEVVLREPPTRLAVTLQGRVVPDGVGIRTVGVPLRPHTSRVTTTKA